MWGQSRTIQFCFLLLLLNLFISQDADFIALPMLAALLPRMRMGLGAMAEQVKAPPTSTILIMAERNTLSALQTERLNTAHEGLLIAREAFHTSPELSHLSGRITEIHLKYESKDQLINLNEGVSRSSDFKIIEFDLLNLLGDKSDFSHSFLYELQLSLLSSILHEHPDFCKKFAQSIRALFILESGSWIMQKKIQSISDKLNTQTPPSYYIQKPRPAHLNIYPTGPIINGPLLREQHFRLIPLYAMKPNAKEEQVIIYNAKNTPAWILIFAFLTERAQESEKDPFQILLALFSLEPATSQLLIPETYKKFNHFLKQFKIEEDHLILQEPIEKKPPPTRKKGWCGLSGLFITMLFLLQQRRKYCTRKVTTPAPKEKSANEAAIAFFTQETNPLKSSCCLRGYQ
ncbi:MAG: hypothetical protein NTV32_02815 [Gammaproteobacteria bacterium]|nr:hypothetical protein [Gammaproteobacteria bacterium]